MIKIYTFLLSLLLTTAAMAQVPTMFKDINPNGGCYPRGPVVMGSNFYFFAELADDEWKLWKSDGTASGTDQLTNIDVKPMVTSIVMNNELYFNGSNGSGQDGLWKTDGTVNGTVLVKDLNSMIDVSILSFAVCNNDLYFLVYEGIDTEHTTLWKSDGTTAGTYQLSAMNLFYCLMMPFNNELYFIGNDASGQELWKTDGTVANTVMIKDIALGAANSYPYFFLEYNNELYFSAETQTLGRELWKTDGTANGTVMVLDNDPAGSSIPANLVIYNSLLYFSTSSPDFTGLWRSDGTSNGTWMLDNIIDGAGVIIGINEMRVLGNTIFLCASNDIYPSQLWKSDGTPVGTVLVKDINSTAPKHPQYFVEYHQKLYFSANSDSEGREIWVSDGTDNGTHILLDVFSGTNGSYPDWLFVFDESLYFRATDGTYDTEWWKLTDITTSVMTSNLSASVNLYPNPIQNILNVEFPESVTISTVEVLNQMSQVMKEFKLNTSGTLNLDLSDLKAGLYILKITDAEGNVITKKVVMQ